MIDNRTTHLDLPLPDAENQLNEDVPRIIAAFQAIDAELQLKSTAADIAAAVAALIGAAPSALDTLAELALAIGNDANLSASVTAHLGSGGSAHSVATAIAAGFMSASDKSNLDAHLGAGGSVHSDVTTSVAGFMSASDKTKINAISGSNTGDQTLGSLGAQAALVSGTNIKTINNQSILGAGNMDAPIPEPYLLMNQGVI